MSLEKGLWPLVQALDAALLREGKNLGLWESVRDSYQKVLEQVVSKSSFEANEVFFKSILRAKGEQVKLNNAPAVPKFFRFLVKYLVHGLQSDGVGLEEANEKQSYWYDRIRCVLTAPPDDKWGPEALRAMFEECVEAWAELEIKYGS